MTEELQQQFFELETSLHKKGIRNSREKVTELIADDFIEFGKSGNVYTKQDILDDLEKETADLEIKVSDFKARELSSIVVLVFYTATMLDTDKISTVTTRRSSIWIQKEGRWQMAFHQGSKVQI